MKKNLIPQWYLWGWNHYCGYFYYYYIIIFLLLLKQMET